ncbi:MAG: hypothetical protein ABIR81_04245 [Ginsengibacter sp.]
MAMSDNFNGIVVYKIQQVSYVKWFWQVGRCTGLKYYQFSHLNCPISLNRQLLRRMISLRTLRMIYGGGNRLMDKTFSHT